MPISMSFLISESLCMGIWCLPPHNPPARDLRRIPRQPILPSLKHGAHLQHCLRISLISGLAQSLNDPFQLYGGPLKVRGATL